MHLTGKHNADEAEHGVGRIAPAGMAPEFEVRLNGPAVRGVELAIGLDLALEAVSEAGIRGQLAGAVGDAELIVWA